MFTRNLIALFVFSAALLALELSYTKLFSVLLWYHFGFLVVSSAMLGFAAAGVFLTFVGPRARRFDFFTLICAASASVLVCYALLLQVDAGAASKTPTLATALVLGSVVLLLLVPFLLIGLAVSWVIASERERIGAVYGANLIGSGVGAPVFLLLFNNTRGEIVPFLITLMMLVSALFVMKRPSQLVPWAAIAATAGGFLAFSGNIDLVPSQYKVLAQIENPEEEVLYSSWSSVSRVDVFRDPDRNAGRGVGLWGLSQRFLKSGKPLPERHGVVIDAAAYATILKYPQDLEFFDSLPSTFVYHLGDEYERALVLGAGGGMDLVAAHHYGVSEVDGVEINRRIVESVQTDFEDFAGGLYTGGVPGVRIHVSEGRSFLERTDGRYNLIQLSGVDTSSASEAGAFALAENYLYTREAFVSYLQHLEPGGTLTLTRLHLPDKQGRKTYSLRLAAIVREALEEIGLDPRGRVFFLRDAPRGITTVMVVKLDPFTEDEVQNGLAHSKRNGFVPMVVPGQERPSVYEDFLYSDRATYASLVADYPYMVGSPTDNQPFVFELQRIRTAFRDTAWPVKSSTITGQETLLVLLGELVLAGIVLLLLPTRWIARNRGIRISPTAWIYFALIGFAYIAIEIVLAQKMVLYLGHPSYALSVVIAGMLVFSGLASWMSERLGPSQRWLLVALVPVLIGVGWSMNTVLGYSLQAAFATRLTVAILYLAPLAFLMGIPFPLGVRQVDDASVPFLWGVNGFFSVVGSVSAVLISMNLGYSTVFAVASLAYAGAALTMLRGRARFASTAT